jgi:hypothetical protein
VNSGLRHLLCDIRVETWVLMCCAVEGIAGSRGKNQLFNFTLFTFTNAQSFGTVKFLWVIISGEIVKKRSVTGRHAGARRRSARQPLGKRTGRKVRGNSAHNHNYCSTRANSSEEEEQAANGTREPNAHFDCLVIPRSSNLPKLTQCYQKRDSS